MACDDMWHFGMIATDMTRPFWKPCVVAALCVAFVGSFGPTPLNCNGRPRLKQLYGQSKQNGYQFGDFTRKMIKNTQGKVNKITGKDRYELGDLTRWADQKAKDRIQKSRSNKTESTNSTYKYEVGDITRWATDFAKEKAARYAGKQTSDEYEFGDVSRTILAKVQSGEYHSEDVYLALRVLLAAGVSVIPIANVLPVKLLLQMVEFDLAKEVGGRLTSVLATTVDSRFKRALTGDAEYQLGDVSKRKLLQALAEFTGKDSYEFGDIAKTLTKGVARKQEESVRAPELERQLPADFSEWDAKFLESWDDKRTKGRDC